MSKNDERHIFEAIPSHWGFIYSTNDLLRFSRRQRKQTIHFPQGVYILKYGEGERVNETANGDTQLVALSDLWSSVLTS